MVIGRQELETLLVLNGCPKCHNELTYEQLILYTWYEMPLTYWFNIRRCHLAVRCINSDCKFCYVFYVTSAFDLDDIYTKVFGHEYSRRT